MKKRGMTMPIQIIIVLFVTLTVATVIIAFSTDIIRNARTKLAAYNKETPQIDQVVEVDSITIDGIRGLAQECLKTNTQNVAEKLCFVIHGRTNDAGGISEEALLVNGATGRMLPQAGSDSSKAIFIKYYPSKDGIPNTIEVSP
jgi:hypothetical protein